MLIPFVVGFGAGEFARQDTNDVRGHAGLFRNDQSFSHAARTI